MQTQVYLSNSAHTTNSARTKFENTKQSKMTNNEIHDTTLKRKRTTHTADGKLMCSGRINISCFTSGIHASCYKPGDTSLRRKELDCDYEKRNIHCRMTHIFRNAQQGKGGDDRTFEGMASTLTLGTLVR